MNRRNHSNGALTLALVGVAGGFLCSSCNQQPRLARSRESGTGIGMDTSVAPAWRGDEIAKEGTANWRGNESDPFGNHDTYGLLDPTTEQCIKKYGPAVKRYAARYGFDWRLILAIMKQGSGNSDNSEGRTANTGVIQPVSMPGEVRVAKLRLEGLPHPEHTIQTSVFYLRNLYDLFDGSGEADRLNLMLAAYNAGLVRVNDAQDLARYLHNEPTQWLAVRDALPLLSRQFSTLHRSIWGQEKPRSGWFDNSTATIQYVDAVMEDFNAFRSLLN